MVLGRLDLAYQQHVSEKHTSTTHKSKNLKDSFVFKDTKFRLFHVVLHPISAGLFMNETASY